LAFTAPVMMQAQAGKANFSGTWTLNESKSTLPQGGGGQRMGGGSFAITQEANLLTRTSTGQDGTQRVSKYTLDGKESVNTTRGGESKSTAKWSADGKKLTIVTKSNFNGNERTSTAVWSLIDAKTLSIASTRQGRDGEVKTTMVYDKK
jgi:Tol biopolymer transport system component